MNKENETLDDTYQEFWNDMLSLCEKYKDKTATSLFVYYTFIFGAYLGISCAPQEKMVINIFEQALDEAKKRKKEKRGSS